MIKYFSVFILIALSAQGILAKAETNLCDRLGDDKAKLTCLQKIYSAHFDDEALKNCGYFKTTSGLFKCFDAVSGHTFQPHAFDACTTAVGYVPTTVGDKAMWSGDEEDAPQVKQSDAKTEELWLSCLKKVADQTYDLEKLSHCKFNSSDALNKCIDMAKTTPAKLAEGCSYTDEKPVVISGPACGVKDGPACIAKANCQTKKYGVVETTLACKAINGACPADATACSKDTNVLSKQVEIAASNQPQKNQSKAQGGKN